LANELDRAVGFFRLKQQRLAMSTSTFISSLLKTSPSY